MSFPTDSLKEFITFVLIVFFVALIIQVLFGGILEVFIELTKSEFSSLILFLSPILIVSIILILFHEKSKEMDEFKNNSKLKKITIVGYLSAILSPIIYLVFKINWQYISSNTIYKDWIMLSVPLAILALVISIYLISKKSQFKKHGFIIFLIMVIFYICLLKLTYYP